MNETSLTRAAFALKNLVAWLIDNGHLTEKNPEAYALEHDPEQDIRNAADPRAFCYVTPGEVGIIYCARALGNLPDRALVGILLHELGHIELGAFNGDESEVDVDEWGTGIGVGYQYADVVYYRSLGDTVVAENIEVVSPEFAAQIMAR